MDLNKTLYISPLMVMTDKEYTKHYFIEGERICTKVGGGFRIANTNPDEVILPFISGTAQTVADDVGTMVLRGVDCSGYEVAQVEIGKTLRPATKNWLRKERQLYYYFPDHLGSSSFITNAAGEAEEHLQYLPFGEIFVQQQNSNYDTRYKFSAKELDPETNYSYFGARYYDSDLSVWLSVDPLSDKYPGLSPYMYVAGNPLVLIDPDGREFDPASEKYIKQYKSTIKSRISELKELRKQDGADIGSINSQLNELRSARRELRVLKRSNVMFKVREFTMEEFKHHSTPFTAYDESDNAVYIYADFMSDLAHELRHAYGLLVGEISYNKNSGFDHQDPSTWSAALDLQPGRLYDLRDEEVAFKRGWSFMTEKDKPGPIGFENITKFSDWNIGNPKTQGFYNDYIDIYNIGAKALSIENVSPELLKNQILFTK